MYGLIVVRILTGLPRFRRSQLPTATAATLIVRVGNIDGNGDVGYAMWIVDRGMWDVGYGMWDCSGPCGTCNAVGRTLVMLPYLKVPYLRSQHGPT